MSFQADSQPLLDHIVILVTFQDLQELPKRLENDLVVIDGGEHAGGLTVNKLIIFPDGTYIELIAFNKGAGPEERKKHRWGQLEEGTIIDWALTLRDESDFGAVQERVRNADAGILYSDLVAGGRTRPDGTVLKWSISTAEVTSGNPVQPGHASFWCLDRTPRRLRVPYQDEQENGQARSLLAHTQHPSGAQGVSYLAVSVSEKEFSSLRAVYDAVLKANSDAGSEDTEWRFEVPSGSRDGPRRISLSTLQQDSTKIKLSLLGHDDSPKTIKLLPGLVIDIEVSDKS